MSARLEVPLGVLPLQFVVDGPFAPLDCSPAIGAPSAHGAAELAAQGRPWHRGHP
jgi:hypothetical protein